MFQGQALGLVVAKAKQLWNYAVGLYAAPWKSGLQGGVIFRWPQLSCSEMFAVALLCFVASVVFAELHFAVHQILLKPLDCRTAVWLLGPSGGCLLTDLCRRRRCPLRHLARDQISAVYVAVNTCVKSNNR